MHGRTELGGLVEEEHTAMGQADRARADHLAPASDHGRHRVVVVRREERRSLDQRRFAGLGNIYVDEALYEAGIRPDTPAGLVSPAATKRLFASARGVLERGIANRGASFKDYVDGQGEQGSQHMYVQVFRRTGQPCYRCASTILRTVVGGRSTHFCPKCQPKSRVKAAARG